MLQREGGAQFAARPLHRLQPDHPHRGLAALQRIGGAKGVMTLLLELEAEELPRLGHGPEPSRPCHRPRVRTASGGRMERAHEHREECPEGNREPRSGT